MNTRPTPETDLWVTFCDEWNYQTSSIRRKNELGWSDLFITHTEDDAKGLCETLNKLEHALATVTAQRDMLVEALEIAANRFRYPEFGCNWENVSKEIESALESLSPKP